MLYYKLVFTVKIHHVVTEELSSTSNPAHSDQLTFQVDGLGQGGSQRHRVLRGELETQAFHLIHLQRTGGSSLYVMRSSSTGKCDVSAQKQTNKTHKLKLVSPQRWSFNQIGMVDLI